MREVAMLNSSFSKLKKTKRKARGHCQEDYRKLRMRAIALESIKWIRTIVCMKNLDSKIIKAGYHQTNKIINSRVLEILKVRYLRISLSTKANS